MLSSLLTKDFGLPLPHRCPPLLELFVGLFQGIIGALVPKFQAGAFYSYHVYRSKIVCGRIVDWHKEKRRSSRYGTGVPMTYIYLADPRRYGSRDRIYPILPLTEWPLLSESELIVIGGLHEK